MPLVIQFNGPAAAPKIFCDHCGQEILEAKDGNYQWSHAGGCDDGQTAVIYFTHKACCDAFERTHGDPYAWGAIGLEALPYFLMQNLKVSWREAQAKGRWMSGQG
jgi:hypothetical protein